MGWPVRNTGAGTLGITKDGTNTLILTSANTYGGDTRVINGGILELGNVNALGRTARWIVRPATRAAQLRHAHQRHSWWLERRQRAWVDERLGPAVALTIGGNGQTNTFSGVLSDSGSLTKTGTGTQTLSGANTYAGSTTVSAGTLLVNGALAGGGAVTVASGATLGGTGVIAGGLRAAAACARQRHRQADRQQHRDAAGHGGVMQLNRPTRRTATTWRPSVLCSGARSR